jgi:hypothetical protein
MEKHRAKAVLWTYLLAVGSALLPALVAGNFAWKAADAFLSKITSDAEMLLFKFSLFFGIAILFLSVAICILLSLTLRGKMSSDATT